MTPELNEARLVSKGHIKKYCELSLIQAHHVQGAFSQLRFASTVGLHPVPRADKLTAVILSPSDQWLSSRHKSGPNKDFRCWTSHATGRWRRFRASRIPLERHRDLSQIPCVTRVD